MPVVLTYCSIYVTLPIADSYTERCIVPEKKKRFTLDLDPEMQMRLKIAAALKSISMRRYCLDAIEKELAKEDIGFSEPASFNLAAFGRVGALRDEIFQGRESQTDSVELIREAREIRTEKLERRSGG